MSQQSVRQAARRSALDAQAVLRKERADRPTRPMGIAYAATHRRPRLGHQTRQIYVTVLWTSPALAPPGKQPSLLPEEPPQVVTDRHRQRGRAVDRDGRVSAYTWLLKHGDDTQLFTHLDGAPLVDVWPDVAPHLTEKFRSQWGPLVLSAGEGWLDEHLIASFQAGRPKSVSRQAREGAIQRLADRGLTADEIRRVLRRR
jgi:hypothetical protein